MTIAAHSPFIKMDIVHMSLEGLFSLFVGTFDAFIEGASVSISIFTQHSVSKPCVIVIVCSSERS